MKTSCALYRSHNLSAGILYCTRNAACAVGNCLPTTVLKPFGLVSGFDLN